MKRGLNKMSTDDKTLHLVEPPPESEKIAVNWNDFASTLQVIDDRVGLVVDGYYEYITDNETEMGIDADHIALGQDLGREFKVLLIEHKGIIPELFNWIENQLDNFDFGYILNPDDDMKIASHRLMLCIQYELLVGAYDEQEEQEETSAAETQTETSTEESEET